MSGEQPRDMLKTGMSFGDMNVAGQRSSQRGEVISTSGFAQPDSQEVRFA